MSEQYNNDGYARWDGYQCPGCNETACFATIHDDLWICNNCDKVIDPTNA